jgi:hypothetical protein
MSYKLNLSAQTDPGLMVDYKGMGLPIFFGSHDVGLEDFLFAAHYVLTNTDITGHDDPRLQFLRCMKEMELTPGYNSGGERLASPLKPVLPQNEAPQQ